MPRNWLAIIWLDDCTSGRRVKTDMQARSALQPAPHTTGNGVVEDVRGIEGLPTDAFLAVRGNTPCGPLGAADWWIARADDVSAERLQSLSPRLREVIKP